MTGGGGGRPDGRAPPSSPPTGGEFLLQLLQNPPQQSQSQTPPPPLPHHHQHPDPAVAALGPTLPFPSNGGHHLPPPPWMNPTNFSASSPPNNTPWGLAGLPPPPNLQSTVNHHYPSPPPPVFADEFQRLGLLGSGNGRHGQEQQQGGSSRMMFGSMGSGGFNENLSDQFSREVAPQFGVPKGFNNGNLLDKFDRMNVEAQFSGEVVGGSRSNDIWSNSSHRSEFDRQQWDNSPPVGGGVGRGRQYQHQPQQQQHGQLRTSPGMEPRSAPPGFSGKPKGFNQSGSTSARRELQGNVDREKGSHANHGKFNNKATQSFRNDDGVRSNPSNHHGNQNNAASRLQLSGQLDHPGLPGGSKLWSVPASDIEQALATVHEQIPEEDGGWNSARHGNRNRDEESGPISQMNVRRLQDDLSHKLMNSVRLSNGLEKNTNRHEGNFVDKDHRPDISRQLQPPGNRMRSNRRIVECRIDIDRMNEPLLVIYASLVPAEEEKAKQRQLLTSLEKLVTAEWPKAQLYLYGSCANSFGVSKSDIDVCLAIEDEDVNKSELLLKLADILQENNLENVQALTRARVPIVKLLDPATGISCDICVNNVLAVVNTKLLRDYAQIDPRLRQLAFIVKHWAKLRGVNVTYHGTLSSYAYVLMCIHFLQQRRPAILPCLQGMAATHIVTVDDIECSFFDQVENLRDYGARNRETIAQLVWAFFDYWAYRHDYANAVISVRTGTIISKRAKEWTRRVGNDRHLICIEDPFEVSHDLGRVVDKYSIKILREEFERAANVMQYDPDPCVTLFEPYIPPPPPTPPTTDSATTK